jgi:hypothetical protein
MIEAENPDSVYLTITLRQYIANSIFKLVWKQNFCE